MTKKISRRRKAIIRRRIFLACCSLLLISTVALIVFIIGAVMGKGNEKIKTDISSETTVVSEPKFEETYATIVSTGDIMVHDPQLAGAYNSSTGEYDFGDFFKELTPYFSSADLAVANLEVTFGGSEAGSYKGYPAFNCPDSLGNAIKSAGLNLLLTANNHSYDTGLSGFLRTQEILDNFGLEYTGTRKTEQDPSYIVKEINNIKIGITNFTYETAGDLQGRKYLNGILLSQEANGLINSFSYNRIEEFYLTAQSHVTEMKEKGAEFIVFYIHWGNEYQNQPNTWQKSIAQKLSNMGVDMIIGSHPHVIQPVELLYSEDGQNTTVCLYSTGNAISNQRQEVMDSCPTGHTEDGMLFSFTLKKTEDGVLLDDLDIIPTWVDKYKGDNGKYKYTIYPLEKENDGADKFSLSTATVARAAKSYKRTIEIIGDGLTACQREIGCEITFENIS